MRVHLRNHNLLTATLVIFLLITLLACGKPGEERGNSAAAIKFASAQSRIVTGREGLIGSIWGGIKAPIRQRLNDATTYPGSLYFFELSAHLLFSYAAQKGNFSILNDIAELTLLPLEHLAKSQTKYLYFTGNYSVNNGFSSLPLAKSSSYWMDASGKESLLASGQFLYFVAHQVNRFLDFGSKATPAMKQVITSYPEVLKEHFDRWTSDPNGMYHVIGWRCTSQVRYTLPAFLSATLNKTLGNNHSYCNYLDDGAIQVVAAMAELLEANVKAPTKISLSPSQIAQYKQVVQLGMSLIEDRVKETLLPNFSGGFSRGAVIDPGTWSEHQDFKYAGYLGETFPISSTGSAVVSPEPSKVVSWDISHARRFVFLLDSFGRVNHIIGTAFPAAELITKLSNQIAYKIFNRDFTNPKFTNYWDGSNGWYRVDYSNRKGWGYSPYAQSAEWLSAGYCTWKRYNPDLRRVCQSTWQMAVSTKSAVVAERTKTYEEGLYADFKPSHRNIFDLTKKSTSQDMMLFLISLEIQ